MALLNLKQVILVVDEQKWKDAWKSNLHYIDEALIDIPNTIFIVNGAASLDDVTAGVLTDFINEYIDTFEDKANILAQMEIIAFNGAINTILPFGGSKDKVESALSDFEENIAYSNSEISLSYAIGRLSSYSSVTVSKIIYLFSSGNSDFVSTALINQAKDNNIKVNVVVLSSI